MLNDAIFVNVQKRQICRDKEENWFPGAWSGEMGEVGVMAQRYGVSFGGDENAVKLIVMAAQVCESIQSN